MSVKVLHSAIDTWDPSTLPVDIKERLNNSTTLLTKYYERRAALDNGLVHDEIELILRKNDYSSGYYDIVEHWLTPRLECEHLRAWHYTRLTDIEVEAMRCDGIQISTDDRMMKRLGLMETKGHLAASEIQAIVAGSPLRSKEQLAGRLDKFWMISKPLPLDNSGITLLIGHWGGEVVYFWQQDLEVIKKLQALGKPRIVEVAIPISKTCHAFTAAQNIVTNYYLLNTGKSDIEAFDLYSREDLPAPSILNIHSEGEPSFEELAMGL